MAEFQYKAGLNQVGVYQVSSIPYVSQLTAPVNTDQPLEIILPSVTKFIVIKNVDSGNHPLRVGFSANGIVGTNYFTLQKNESFSADFKITKLYLLGDSPNTVGVELIAGLTGIEKSQLPNSWSGSLGVG